MHPNSAYSQDFRGSVTFQIARIRACGDHIGTRERGRYRAQYGKVPSGPDRAGSVPAGRTLRRARQRARQSAGRLRQAVCSPGDGRPPAKDPGRSTGRIRQQLRSGVRNGLDHSGFRCGTAKRVATVRATGSAPHALSGRRALPEARVLTAAGSGNGRTRSGHRVHAPATGQVRHAAGVYRQGHSHCAPVSDLVALASTSLHGSWGVGRVFAGHLARISGSARPAPQLLPEYRITPRITTVFRGSGRYCTIYGVIGPRRFGATGPWPY